QYTLTVAAPAFTIDPLAPPQVAVGVNQPLVVHGGTGPYRLFYVIAGALPAGLRLSSNGVLTGTPTAGGTFTFTVRAFDSSTGTGPYQARHTLSLTVTAPTVVITTTSLSATPVGMSFTRPIQASGGTGAKHFTL